MKTDTMWSFKKNKIFFPLHGDAEIRNNAITKK